MALANRSLALDSLKEKEEDEDKKKKDKSSKKSKTTGIVAGIGSTLTGPIGGALIGAGASAVDANRADKKTDPNRPKHRSLAKGLEQFKERGRKREVALATLSQAVFDWANSIR